MYPKASSRLLEESSSGGFNLETSGYFADLALSNENFKADGSSGIPNLNSKAKAMLLDAYGIFYHYYRYGNLDDMYKAHLTGLLQLVLAHVEGKIHDAINGNKKLGTNYLKNFRENFKFNKAENMKNLKYVGLSGHQANIYALFHKLNLSSVKCMSDRLNGKAAPPKTKMKCSKTPDFASNFIFELS